MCGITHMDRVRNGVVRRRTGAAEQSVLRWFGHIERMEKDQLVKKIIGSEARGVRLQGRPRMGWMDAVKRAFNERGLSVKQG